MTRANLIGETADWSCGLTRLEALTQGMHEEPLSERGPAQSALAAGILSWLDTDDVPATVAA